MTALEDVLLRTTGQLIARAEKAEERLAAVEAELRRTNNRINDLLAQRQHDNLSRSRGAPVRSW